MEELSVIQPEEQTRSSGVGKRRVSDHSYTLA